VNERLEDLTLGFLLYRSSDYLIVYEGNVLANQIDFRADRIGPISVDFDFTAHLTRGHYHAECYVLHNPTHRYISRLLPAAMFSVEEDFTCRGVADVELRASVTHGVGGFHEVHS
jgi:hypothetical protein